MIRKRITYKLKQNLTQGIVFFGVKISIPNKPLYYPDMFIVGSSIEETIDNYLATAILDLNNLNLQGFINVTRSAVDSITFDYIADGDAWGGYGDLNTYDPIFLVYETSGEIVNKYYSDAENDTVKVSTETYNQGGDIVPEEFGINGLGSDNYYIDNDVYVSIAPEPTGQSVYVDIVVTDLQNRKQINSRIYYLNNNTLILDFALIIKGLMNLPKANFDYSNLTPYPINTNYGNYNISIIRYFTEQNSFVIKAGTLISINKTFIRGGQIAQGNNITAIENVPLRSCEKLPIWNGYPTAEYRLVNGIIYQYNDLTNVNKENRPDIGCNAYYFKFKNRKGGYSYWLFPKEKNDISAANVGYSNLYGNITDFGSNISQTQEVSGKIPFEFKELAIDLITSSETYCYLGNNKWSKVIQKSNKVTQNTLKRTFDVVFKFENISNYNPTV